MLDDDTGAAITPVQSNRIALEALPSEADGPVKWKRGLELVFSQELAEELDDLLESFLSEDSCEEFLEDWDNSWMPPANDSSIPQDDAARLRCVKRFVRVLVSIKKAVDADNNKLFGTRWTPARLDAPPYDKTLIVIRCLKLVDLMIDLHKKGPSVLRCFNK